MTRDQREAGLTQEEAGAEYGDCSINGCDGSPEPLHAYCRGCEEAMSDEHGRLNKRRPAWTLNSKQYARREALIIGRRERGEI